MKSQKDKLTAADYLFYYENKMIPMLFYSDDMDFFGAIAENPTSFYEIFRDACKSNGIRQDYTVNDFDVILSQPEDGWFALTLTFPIPQKPGFCYDIYLFQQCGCIGRGCYTLERFSDKKGGDLLLLGGWDAKENHTVYQTFPVEDEDYCAKAFAIHKRKIEETEGKS